jgi:CDP-paratose 2-epimerase
MGFSHILLKSLFRENHNTIFGYKGKQVRDNIHSRDVIAAFESFAKNPRPGEVYNLGGGRGNSVSMLEAIDLVEQVADTKINYQYITKSG